MGLRIFFILLVVWAIALIVRTLVRTKIDPPPVKPVTDNTTLIKCEYCGVHCVDASAFHYQEYHFCCKAHLDQYLQYTEKKPGA